MQNSIASNLDQFKAQGVILTRQPGGDATANIPQAVIYHSPDGFEWGYGGSGPADLALNIVEHYLNLTDWNGQRVKASKGTQGFNMSFLLHQQFKDDFIVGLAQEESHVIPFADIETWMAARLAPHIDDNDDGYIEEDDFDDSEDDDDYDDDDGYDDDDDGYDDDDYDLYDTENDLKDDEED